MILVSSIGPIVAALPLACVTYAFGMTPAQLRIRLESNLKEAMPLDGPSTLNDPQSVADFAAKKTCLIADEPGELIDRAAQVRTARQCAALLADCLRYIPRAEPTASVSNGAMSPAQVAEILGVSRGTVYKLCEQQACPTTASVSESRLLRSSWRNSSVDNSKQVIAILG